MSLSIRLIDSNASIERDITRALAKDMNLSITKRSERVKADIKKRILGWIHEQPETQSLLQEGTPNSLNAHFGLPMGSSAGSMDSILASVAESILVKITKIKSNLTGGVEFLIQPERFSNLMGLSAGHITTDRGTDLHWLDWLLNYSSTPVVVGYEYTPSYKGRSGGGTMRGGSVWRVPPQFSGTPENNFITKALDNREKELTIILKGLFE